jgi:hypothetical protein
MKKRRKDVSSPNYIAKSLRSSKFSQKVLQSKKLYNRKKEKSDTLKAAANKENK